ncbi:unnamed protein product, partial [Prorocentrum cordatum]
MSIFLSTGLKFGRCSFSKSASAMVGRWNRTSSASPVWPRARIPDAPRQHQRGGDVAFLKGARAQRCPHVQQRWVEDDPRAFQRKHRHQLERPWVDVGIVAELQRAHYPYTCELIGIFRDDHCTYVVSSLASHGDMFMWAEKA